MTEGEVDNLLHFVPHAMRSGCVTQWERKFLISIAGRMRRGSFRPTSKQVRTLAPIIAKFKKQSLASEARGDEGHEVG